MILVQRSNVFGRCAACNLSVPQIRPLLYFYARRTCSNSSKDKLISLFEHNNHVLKILNNKNSNYLSRFKIPESQINSLELHREKHGPYKSLHDVLQVDGMNESILNEFLQSVISDKQYKKGQKSKKSIIVPSIENIPCEKISTVLGIYIGTNIITWILIECKENILEWNYKSFSNIPENNMFNLLDMVSQLNLILPKSDAYVVDNVDYDHRIAKSIICMRAFLQKQQLRAMILAFLANRNSSSVETEGNESESMGNLYLTQHDKVANLFGLRVGNEITSSATIISKLLYEEDNINDRRKNPIGIYASKNVMEIYQNQVDYIRDQMNWSLLTALTFLQLGIHKKYHCEFI